MLGDISGSVLVQGICCFLDLQGWLGTKHSHIREPADPKANPAVLAETTGSPSPSSLPFLDLGMFTQLTVLQVTNSTKYTAAGVPQF